MTSTAATPEMHSEIQPGEAKDVNITSTAVTPETQSGNQPGGPLFKLPKELRRMIYRLVLPPGEIRLYSIRDHLKQAPGVKPFHGGPSASQLTARDYIALLKTCSTIHDDAKSEVYENTKFVIQCSWDHVRRRGTLPYVFQHLKHARSVKLEVEVGEDERLPDVWMHKMPDQLSEAVNLKRLEISI
jgi:hypothetical protein